MNIDLKLTLQRLTADRKRFAFLCALVMVGLLLWARIIVIERPPRTAVAGDTIEEVADSGSTSDNNTVLVTLDIAATVNPFALSSSTFPIPTEETDNTMEKRSIERIGTEQEIVSNLVLDAVIGQIVMINGRVYNVGDVVARQDDPDPLRIAEVVGRSVIISAGDRRYELTIASRKPK